MCRGVKLGPCIAVGCDKTVQCRDNGGFCYEHCWDVGLCDCEGLCTCKPHEDPEVDPARELRYLIARGEEGIASMRLTIDKTTERLALLERHQAERYRRLAALFA
jgi:hypothetical protein